MSSPKFAEMHNVVAFLEKPVESDGFAEIIDFLKASSVHYALTVNPIIYTSCTEQFWAKAKVQTVNGVRQLQALVDKKRVIITESSIRSDLHLEDAGGTDCLLTATIFEELARMGYEKPSQKHSFLHSGIFINQQLGDMSHHKKIYVNPSHTKKVFANMKRAGKDFSRRITPLFDTMTVQPSKEVGEDSDHPTDSNQIPIIDQPSTSSQSRNKSPRGNRGRRQKLLMMRQSMRKVYPHLPMIHYLVEIVDLKKRVQRLERKKKSRTTGLKRLKKVGMSRRVESSKDQEIFGDHKDASKQGRSIEDIDADAEVTLVNETQESKKDEQSTKPDDSTTGEVVTTASVEDLARDVQAQLEAELIEEEKLARKQEEEANIALIMSWDNTQAMMEADFELA
ncbi:hypothetical protein Tco_0272238 [Tanacetum coccineum]